MRVLTYSFAFALISLPATAIATEIRTVGIGEVLATMNFERRANVDLAQTQAPFERKIYIFAKIRLPSGTDLEWSPAEGTYCTAGKGYIDSNNVESTICLFDTDNDGSFDKVDGPEISKAEMIKVPVPYRKRRDTVLDSAPVLRRLVYLGGNAAEIRFSYREFTRDGLARAAFTEDLIVPIQSFPSKVSLKGVKFTVHAQSSDGLAVEVQEQ